MSSPLYPSNPPSPTSSNPSIYLSDSSPPKPKNQHFLFCSDLFNLFTPPPLKPPSPSSSATTTCPSPAACHTRNPRFPFSGEDFLFVLHLSVLNGPWILALFAESNHGGSHVWLGLGISFHLQFLSHHALGELLTEEDQKFCAFHCGFVFKYLSSLDVEDAKDVKSGYCITFHLNPNLYSEDENVTKTFTFREEGTTKME
ncbi:hypothetical protein YC2023_078892 [Brassica napus]